MESGLLWYDSDPRRALEDKIGRAVQRYHEKYGHWPNTCYVHPQAMADGSEQILRIACPVMKNRTTIQVVAASNILLHHYWLGRNAREAASRQSKVAS